MKVLSPVVAQADSGQWDFNPQPLRAGAAPPLGRLIALFLAYQSRRGRQPSTIRHAEVMLRPFLAWAGADAMPADVSLRDVELDFMPCWEADFQARNGHSPSRSSQRCMHLTIRSLYAFADRFDLLLDHDGNIVRNPLRKLEAPPASTPNVRTLSPEAGAALLGAARTPRERIITQLLHWTGVRAGEAVSILDDDVDLDRMEIRIRRSKTARGVRTIPVLPLSH